MQAQALRHSDKQACHRPDETWAVMSANQEQKDDECLDYGYVWNVEEVGLRESMLEAKAVFEVKVSLCGAKIRDDLG